MNTNHNNFDTTCILLFSQSEAQESKTKFIALNKRQNILLWKKMNERVLGLVQKSKIKYIHFNEKNQIGNSFGEKLSNAIENVFEKGYHKVIVLGNDCPQLTTRTITEAASKIQKSDFVFGPDVNGGLYLIALAKENFNKEQFISFDWNTRNLFTNITNTYCNHSIEILNTLHDFNSKETLKKIIFKFSFNSLFRSSILSFLKPFFCCCFCSKSFINTDQSSILYNKGSPIFLF